MIFGYMYLENHFSDRLGPEKLITGLQFQFRKDKKVGGLC